MNTKFELVLTVWQDGLFKVRDRIEAVSIESLEEQFEIAKDNIEKVLAERSRSYDIGEDDDIPF